MEGFRTLKGNVVISRAEISMQQIYSPGQGDNIFSTPVALYIDFLDTLNKVQLPFLVMDIVWVPITKPIWAVRENMFPDHLAR
jgi:hypothetical protein